MGKGIWKTIGVCNCKCYLYIRYTPNRIVCAENMELSVRLLDDVKWKPVILDFLHMLLPLNTINEILLVEKLVADFTDVAKSTTTTNNTWGAVVQPNKNKLMGLILWRIDNDCLIILRCASLSTTSILGLLMAEAYAYALKRGLKRIKLDLEGSRGYRIISYAEYGNFMLFGCNESDPPTLDEDDVITINEKADELPIIQSRKCDQNLGFLLCELPAMPTNQIRHYTIKGDVFTGTAILWAVHAETDVKSSMGKRRYYGYLRIIG